MRYAVIHAKGVDIAERIARYLPGGYEVLDAQDDKVIIGGVDIAGWTLDDYVIPRLASGLYFAEEISPYEAEKLGVVV